jgi:antibiotic biosynthesis monooxygenase (ABM) superfamily enzyme
MSDHQPHETHETHLPVTVVVSRRPVAGRQAELIDWANGITEAAAAFPGHLGAQIYPPSPPEREDLVIAFSFATADDLSAWEHSPQRQDWLDRARTLMVGSQQAHAVSGFEGLFSPTVHATRTPVPRWKTATVIGLAIFPMSLLINWLLGPHISSWNVVPRVALSTLIVVPYMTWVGVPNLTRWLHGWLNPATRT